MTLPDKSRQLYKDTDRSHCHYGNILKVIVTEVKTNPAV
jgi:hypothetical protein